MVFSHGIAAKICARLRLKLIQILMTQAQHLYIMYVYILIAKRDSVSEGL